ncbi:DHS-like NAD/FAD-binding domain-containing protein [Ochromonadaceae sp. CCMP2298]|nr:DHS-like NAD/FAD-binding domain-containing protein [Ochromonadaceae sp. CCMP2298]
MFAVEPKTDCPHIEFLDLDGIIERFNADKLKAPCQTCNDTTENWLCLNCEDTFCSRYMAGHMAVHSEETSHDVALSFSDSSFWCYKCDSYITSKWLDVLRRQVGKLKFPKDIEPAPETVFKMPSVPEESGGEEGVEGEIKSPLSLAQLAAGFRAKEYSKIVFLTGAGISVAAGIPDFRTPGTGLYARVEELGLPYPEAIFSLDYLKAKPEPFFKIANGFLTYKAKPVKAHWFMKKVFDEGLLLKAFTQNIDGLELEAGIPLESLMQAHGHMRSSRCCDCKEEVPIGDFFASVSREEVLYCANCEGGIIKPDIVFFGEALPSEFHDTIADVAEADLVFVMGTSLKVFPFAMLIDLIQKDVPIVLVNRETPEVFNGRNVLFLEGDIEDSLSALAAEIGWELMSGVEDAEQTSGEKAN